jgi:hypothetical protein
VLENGEKMTVALEDLDSYSIDGKIYNKKMLYKNGMPTGTEEYMQPIK